ncbi:hypothetical protein [Streptomyces sp. NPDC056543]|uniref:hypothetical protein n=1 Tax=Streptomyces sp. NPDC056543 TaxID=3345862 RepID=UPI0036A3B6E0
MTVDLHLGEGLQVAERGRGTPILGQRRSRNGYRTRGDEARDHGRGGKAGNATPPN